MSCSFFRRACADFNNDDKKLLSLPMAQKILVTGTAGFIGFSVVDRLLQEDCYDITGLDNINSYYSPKLKLARLEQHGISEEKIAYGTRVRSLSYPNYRFIKLGLEDKIEMGKLFAEEQFDIVIHLAAQGGVRYSLENPHAYIDSNITGFLNILEGCKNTHVKHLIYASSSSVYGANTTVPFSENDAVNSPISLYAATKRSNELMAFTYHHLYQLPTTGLRFFTVYGPWGRPDMSPFLFASAVANKKPIKVFNHGNMRRDFTYIDDIVDGILRVMKGAPKGNKIYNIGNNKPIELLRFIGLIEDEMGQKNEHELLPMQAGDVYETYANIDALSQDFGYIPKTSIEEGVKKFVAWFKQHKDLF